MDESVADGIVDRHWQSVVNSIKVGAVDENLDAVIDAERRREPPRDVVLEELALRQAVVNDDIDAADGRNTDETDGYH